MIDFFRRLFGLSRKCSLSSGITDIGRVRSRNEDGFLILKDRELYLVADGMGGHQAGEVAADLALKATAFFCSPRLLRQVARHKEEIQHFMISVFRRVNDRVMIASENNPAQRGMGCTFVAGLIDKGCLHTCHVGDTRCYIVRENGIEQITNDHTRIADYQRQAGTDDTTAGLLPSRHIVTRAMGFPFDRDPEYHYRLLFPGDRILFCSDGLWSMVDDSTLQQVVRTADTPEAACEKFVRLANAAGGKDNITAVIVFH